MKKPISLLAGLCGAVLLSSAFAADIKWIGPDGGDFSAGANWQGGVKPGAGDRAVFDLGVGKTLMISNQWNVGYGCSGICVKSGTLTGWEGWGYNSFSTQTGTVEVAEGAVYDNWGGYQKGKITFLKRGKGDFIVRGNICSDWSSIGGAVTKENVSRVLVEEGSFQYLYGTSWHAIHLAEVRVAAGARATIGTSWNTVNPNNEFGFDCHVDGSLKVAGGCPSILVDTLTGSGRVTFGSAAIMTPTAENRFDGEIGGTLTLESTGGGTFVVTSPTSLTNASVTTGSTLRFGPAIREISSQYLTVKGGGLRLANESGGAVTFTSRYGFGTNGYVIGPGSVHTLQGIAVLSGNIRMTGELKASVPNSSSVSIGYGGTPGDISTISALEVNGSDSKGTSVYFHNPDPMTVTVPVRGTNSEFIAWGSSLTVDSYEMKATWIETITNLTFNKSAGTASLFKFWGTAEPYPTFTLRSGRLCGGYATCQYYDGGLVKYPNRTSFICNAGEKYGRLRIEGGELYADLSYNSAETKGAVSAVELVGGRLCLYASTFKPKSDATVDNPTTLLIDGGTLVADMRSSCYWWYFASQSADYASRIAIKIGAKGARFERCHADGYSARVVYNSPICNAVSDPGTAVFDSGRFGESVICFYCPFDLTGPVTFRDGQVYCDAARIAAAPNYFGTGDIRLDATVLFYDSQTTSATLRLANADGKRVTCSAASMLNLRNNDSGYQTVEMGAGGASADSVLAREAGAALFLSDNGAAMDGTRSKVLVNGGVAVNDGGVVRKPVFNCRGSNYDFMTYDAANGLVTFTDYATTLTGDVNSYFASSSSCTALAADQTKRVGGMKTTAWRGFTLKSGSRLIVGNGSDPAVAMINYQSGIYGPGTLDFGTSEGVIVVGGYQQDDFSGNTLSAVVAGSGGLSYVAAPFYYRMLRVTAANTYTGPTRVSAASVLVQNEKALSTGDVYVLGGWRNGGKVAFELSDATFANNFHIEGAGHKSKQWDYDWKGWGAITFLGTNVVLNGDIELLNPARIGIKGEGTSGFINGTVSGDQLEICGRGGVVTLAGHNTYKGGTSILRSVESGTATLAVKYGDGLGTGDVLLRPGSVLRFVNTEAITVPNEITGIGRIEFCGTGPVTLAGESFDDLPFRSLGPGSVLDLSDASNNVYYPYLTGDVDLGGVIVKVEGLSGSGSVANGTVIVSGDIQPGGAGALGTLRFGAGVLAFGSGARYVCDVIGSSSDKIEVEGNFGLSQLAFKVVAEGRVLSGKSVVFACTGTRSGTFSSVDMSKKMALKYETSRVILDHFRPGLLVFVLKDGESAD